MSRYAAASTANLAPAIDAGLRSYMGAVYNNMAIGIALTGAVAYAFYTLGITAMLLANPILFYGVMFAPLAVVLLFSFGINRMSSASAGMIFLLFAALMGASLGHIFIAYTGISIAQTFFATAVAFLGLSLYGYTAKRNLSGMGTFLLMGLIGLIVASLINIFLASPALQFAISTIGVLLFAALTAYDTQRIKAEYVEMANVDADGEVMSKSAINGALSLYLNFLNMFMFLLQLMGQSRE